MKQLFKLLRLIRVQLKNCNFKALTISASIWMILATSVHQGSNCPNIAINMLNIFYGNVGNLLQMILLYLSYGIPMLFTLIYLSHSFCEEYYYSRIDFRHLFPLSHICVVLIIQFAITSIQFIILFFTIACSFRDSHYVFNLHYTFNLFIQITYTRFILALIFILLDTIRANITVGFIILTSIILGIIQLLRQYPSPPLLHETNFLTLSNKILAFKLVVSSIMIASILFYSNSQDISLQEDTVKNDL